MRNGKLRKFLAIGLVVVFFLFGVNAIAEESGLAEFESGETVAKLTTSDSVDIDEIRKEIDESWASTITTFTMGGIAVFVVIIVAGLMLHRKQRRKYEAVISGLKKRMFSMKGEAEAKLQSERALNNAERYSIRESNERKLNSINLSHRKEIQALEENIESLEIGLKLYREQYERAVRLYPSLEEEINRMVVKENEERDLERARAFDVAASEFDGRSATRQMVEDLKKTLEMYTLLSPSQKSLVKADVTRIKRMLEEAIAFRKKYEEEKEKESQMQSARHVDEQIQMIIGDIKVAIATDYDRLLLAQKLYNRLDRETAKFVNKSLLDRLSKLLYEAKADKYREFVPRNV